MQQNSTEKEKKKERKKPQQKNKQRRRPTTKAKILNPKQAKKKKRRINQKPNTDMREQFRNKQTIQKKLKAHQTTTTTTTTKNWSLGLGFWNAPELHTAARPHNRLRVNLHLAHLVHKPNNLVLHKKLQQAEHVVAHNRRVGAPLAAAKL